MRYLNNPILPGFYPDPSICRRGQDLYMVTSTFEYFPGVPVFHSRDMVHWHQIGHCLTRPGQLPLDGVLPSKGIYAPTIRYHEGRDLFYMVTTLVPDSSYWGNVNFYVTARDPAGPWSDPVVIQGAEGIDPTLFFDGEKAYYLGNLRPHPENPACRDRHVWLQELDLDTGRLLGERVVLLTDGAVRGASTPEGPHLYHVGDWYYLMIAEGGTSRNHCETIFRSRCLTGPWEANPRNPLITHRGMGAGAAIDSTGHADLVRLSNGEWWAVLLATRPNAGRWRQLGRETFAVPVSWEDDWPVFSPETGRVEARYPAPALPACPWQEMPVCDQFETESLSLVWNELRTPRREVWSLTARPGWLRLFPQAERLADLGHPAFVGRRQQHGSFVVRTKLAFTPHATQQAGLAILMNHKHYVALLYGEDGIRAIRCEDGREELVGFLPCTAGRLWLRLVVRGQSILCSAATTAEAWQTVGGPVDGTCLTHERAGGFTGVYVGMYATVNGGPAAGWADFDWFEYQPLNEEGV